MRLRVRTGSAVAVAVLVAGCSSGTVVAPPGATSTAASGSASRSAPTSTSGLTVCALATLPAQADQVVQDIHRGGPFDYPGNDGVVFGNRERVLPAKARSYYHEYTVPTPGSRTRGARRIVTGGTPLNDPPQYFYTGDHYGSFCEVSGADR